MAAPLLVVTTRSHLTSPVRFGPMWMASRRIRRQLVRDTNVIRSLAAPARALVVSARVRATQTPAALRALEAVRRAAAGSGHVARSSVGLGKPGEVHLLTVWQDITAPSAFLRGPEIGALQQRWPCGVWGQVWVPENEFGTWDGLRLRRGRDRYAIRMPAEALALDR